jgi:hypothetical protein
MKRLFLIPVIALLLPLTGLAQKGTWPVHTSAEGHFSVTFPGTPQESVEYDSSGAEVTKINLAMYEINDSDVLMLSWVSFAHLDLGQKSVKELLETSRDGALSALGATDIVTTATVLTGDPYIEFTFRSGGMLGKDRVYIIHKMQYSILGIFSSDRGLATYADRYIGSFKYKM